MPRRSPGICRATTRSGRACTSISASRSWSRSAISSPSPWASSAGCARSTSSITRSSPAQDGSMAPGFETEDALKRSKQAADYWAKTSTPNQRHRPPSDKSTDGGIRHSPDPRSTRSRRRAAHSRPRTGQALRHARSVPQHRLRCRRTRDRRHRRPVRLRQDHAAALHRWPAAVRHRRSAGRQSARHRADRRRRHGVPAFRSVSVEDRVRERRLWPAHGRRVEGGDRAQGAGFHQAGGLERLREGLSPIRCPAACSSAAGLPAHWPSNRMCC